MGVIEIKDLTVRYRLPNEKLGGVREYLDKKIIGKLRHREFAALTDVSFKVKKGERIGIIGPNGAGKSTLLKVIARVIRPSEGVVCVDGSIAPLLELGAGFDPDLTGIENIYLNGALLGNNKRKLNLLVNEIIDFAELGEFINYPVKNYSSGMRAKLGFAIAAQVDSDILLIDEILSVGDESFMLKSKQKMADIIGSGMTTLIVSHNLKQIVELTSRVIWLDKGRVMEDGEPGEVCDKYREYIQGTKISVPESGKEKPGRAEGEAECGIKPVRVEGEVVCDKKPVRAEGEVVCDKKPVNEEEIILVEKPLAEDVFAPIDINGDVEECKYYCNEGLLFVKGWYMTAQVFDRIEIYSNREVLGKALYKMKKMNENDNLVSSNSLVGWGFIKRIGEEINEIKINLLLGEDIVFSEVKSVVKVGSKCPDVLCYCVSL